MSFASATKRISAKALVLILVSAIFWIAFVTAVQILGMGVAIGALILVAGAITLNAIQKIPANPPHIALVTRLGKRTNEIKKEGWRFFWLRPWFTDFILVNVTKVNQDLPEEQVITPDRAKLSIPVSVTWTPDSDDEPFTNGNGEERIPLIHYLNVGGQKGVENMLEDIIRERVREWASSSAEGPQTWHEAIQSRESAAAVLLKAIVGEELTAISSNIPTTILLKYFSSPKKKLLDSEEKEWGPSWKKVEDTIATDENNSEWQAQAQQQQTTYRDMLTKQVNTRREEIKKARQGNGGFPIQQLGITLNRLNVGEIKPLGGVAETADKQARELQEREGEILELTHVQERIQQFVGIGFSHEAAKEIVMVERGKAVLNITESKWNVSPETRAMLEKIAPDVAAMLGGVFGRSK